MKVHGLILLAACVIWHFAGANKPSHQVIEEAKKYCHDGFNTNHDEAYHAIVKCNPTKPATQQIKCYWHCFLKQLGWVDDRGTPREKPTELNPTPCYVKYGYTCLNATGTDECDKASNFIKCYFEKEQEDFDEHCID